MLAETISKVKNMSYYRREKPLYFFLGLYSA
jgi:hypothetical protein